MPNKKEHIHPALTAAQFRLINRKKDVGRYQRFMQAAKIAGLDDIIVRFNAVEYESINSIPNNFLSQFKYPKNMSIGEFGCYSSHLKICEEFLESKKEFLVVFEDDSLLRPESANILIDLISRLSVQLCGVKAIHLSAIMEEHSSTKIFSLPSVDLHRAGIPPNGTPCYLLTRTAARRWLNMRSRLVADIDLWARPEVVGFWPHVIWPPIANLDPNEHMISTISYTHHHSSKKKNKTLNYFQSFWGVFWIYNIKRMSYCIQKNGILSSIKFFLYPMFIILRRIMFGIKRRSTT